MRRVTLGGERIGSGKKMKVELKSYERSTHDLSYIWRSTMSMGTLVPFMTRIAQPGDTWDISLEVVGMTHPTVGPLFGSAKIQLDVYEAPIRLYNGKLHNNKIGIGLHMDQVKLPQMTLFVDPAAPVTGDIDNAQINPSCLLAYLGVRGVGRVDAAEPGIQERQFNGVPILAYWDIYKNYYSNKQEDFGAMIFNQPESYEQEITSINTSQGVIGHDVPQDPTVITGDTTLWIIMPTGETPLPKGVIFVTDKGNFNMNEVVAQGTEDPADQWNYVWKYAMTGTVEIYYWRYLEIGEVPPAPPVVRKFALEEIDLMREKILEATASFEPFDITEESNANDPWGLLLKWPVSLSTYKASQQGLGLKTYQSDLFNNWLNTEDIDGVGGINDITAVTVNPTTNKFTIDELQLRKKMYNMLNRIAVSGGTYDDWQQAVYDHEIYGKAETPVYHGGLVRELVFQEVVSNSGGMGQQGEQPLGTLAGRGVLGDMKKGGKLSIKVNEWGYLMGIISITPRLDYSQGNRWDMHLQTMADLHAPEMDEIGFQELITEQMAWWDTTKALGGTWMTRSAGKQPAWINYMTDVNEVRGNFAIEDNEMFMVFVRRYEQGDNGFIGDLTTYIDPVKFNHIFADTAIDAQNYWMQISVDITCRRKMSAKLMPNL